jgi:pyrroloquinoline quinone (PQQ) biosynthesis protein C
MTSDILGRLDRESTGLLNAVDEHPLIAAVIGGHASHQEYARFLATTYHYLRWSGPLLAETAEGLRRSRRCTWLVETFDTKTCEESAHGAWVLADLQALGVSPEIVKGSAIPDAVKAYVEWSLTLARDGSPAFLGAAYALEFVSMHRAKVAADNLRAAKTIGEVERAVSFLDGHGEADAGHVALMREVIARVDNPCEEEAIVLSAAVTRTLYPRFFAPQVRRPACDIFAA